MRLACFILITILPVLGQKLKPGELSKDDQNLILVLHNSYRQIPPSGNMNLLKWNETLAQMAYNYILMCLGKHGQPTHPKSPFWMTGQNIYSISPWRKPDYKWALHRWHEEFKYYNYETNECTGMCGHYTQVVWADSMFVGCSFGNCTLMKPQMTKNVTMIICNYAPAGNMETMRPYELGWPCEMCPEDVECVKGLCSSSQKFLLHFH